MVIVGRRMGTTTRTFASRSPGVLCGCLPTRRSVFESPRVRCLYNPRMDTLRAFLLASLALSTACASTSVSTATDASREDRGDVTVTPDVAADATDATATDAAQDASDAARPDVTSDIAPDITSDIAPDVSSDIAPDVSSDTALDVTPDVTADVTPDVAPDVAPDVTADVLRDVAVDREAAVCEPSDCDGDPTNGRETDTRTDPCNCGACGRRCESLRGVTSATCEACSCRVVCDARFRDCDGDPNNGCESLLASDARNCGACGHACGVGEACRSGACVFVPSYTSCSGLMANLYNDVENCGACGHACAAGQVCDRGACAASCAAAGTLRCGTQTCVDLSTHALHCGSCGSTCPGGQTCSLGRCLLGCVAGTTVCAGTCVNLSTDSFNCGACGVICPVRALCNDGVCQSLTCR